MPVKPEKWEELRKRMESLGISEKDLEERFILGSGKGGQKVNKTNSCVYLKHLPSGTDVKCQKDRSREMNRFFARRELCERMEEKDQRQKSAKQQAAEKVRRQKRRRSRRAKEKMLDEKRKRGETKSQRQAPKVHE